MSRCLAELTRDAIEKRDEPLLTKLAETIVKAADALGLDAMDRRYLTMIAENYVGLPL